MECSHCLNRSQLLHKENKVALLLIAVTLQCKVNINSSEKKVSMNSFFYFFISKPLQRAQSTLLVWN